MIPSKRVFSRSVRSGLAGCSPAGDESGSEICCNREQENEGSAHRATLRVGVGALLFAAVLSAFGTLYGQGPPAPVKVSLDEAIQLALRHNHNLNATRTLIPQSRDAEITASLRPNPVFLTDGLFIPFFSPHNLNGSILNDISEFDAGISYTIERGHKRQARVRAARDQTTVTVSQVSDAERLLTYNVAQQFIQVLLAKSTLQFARQDLQGFRNTVSISQEQYKAGGISEGDLLKTQLQLLQFQTDVSSAQVALVQARYGLRQLTGYDAIPANFEVTGVLAYAPVHLNLLDLEARALQLRPDLLAAKQGIAAADSQYGLARANGKQDLTTQINYTHVSALNNASLFGSIQIPIFNRNQGQIAGTRVAIAQAEQTEQATADQVLTDVKNGYAAVQTSAQIVNLYQSGYLKQAKESRDISQYAYRRGAASLLDFLDAERSYRATQLAYRQVLAAYMTSMEQLREAVGTRNLP